MQVRDLRHFKIKINVEVMCAHLTEGTFLSSHRPVGTKGPGADSTGCDLCVHLCTTKPFFKEKLQRAWKSAAC